MKKILAMLFVTINCISCNQNYKIENLEKELKNGDIIFQTSKSNQSKAIQLATNSKYSHVGIVYINDDRLYVYEAVQPVKLTLLEEWVERGENNKYVVKRLKNRNEVIDDKSLLKMKKVGEKFIGKDYDLYFEWSDDKMYCSEVVWKIYKSIGVEIGEIKKLSSFDLNNEVVKSKLKERYGDNIPLDEKGSVTRKYFQF